MGLDWIKLPSIPSYVWSSYYMYHVQVDNRDEFAKYLREKIFILLLDIIPYIGLIFIKVKKNYPILNMQQIILYVYLYIKT